MDQGLILCLLLQVANGVRVACAGARVSVGQYYARPRRGRDDETMHIYCFYYNYYAINRFTICNLIMLIIIIM